MLAPEEASRWTRVGGDSHDPHTCFAVRKILSETKSFAVGVTARECVCVWLAGRVEGAETVDCQAVVEPRESAWLLVDYGP